MSPNRRIRCVAFTASLVSIVMYMSSLEFVHYNNYSSSSRPHSNTMLGTKVKEKISNVKRRELNVLFWRPSFQPYKTPLFSSDKKCQFHFNQSDYNNSEAVIFRCVVFKNKFPNYRPSGQRWLYHAWQSAHNARIFYYLKHPHVPLQFNYTVTYSRNADVYLPYGECGEITGNRQDVKQEIDNIISGKHKLAVWMVSNCDAPSLRQYYVRELSRHMKIDIYGACGDMLCSGAETCQTTISGYKFYLAFENSLCGEYITEKLWRSFEWGLVPVVFGGLDTYKLILPPNSYIDVSDFSSPKMLKDYMIELNSNETLYRSYFDWKYNYKCGRLVTKQKIDRICTFLQKNRQQVVDLNNVWNHHSNRCEQENPLQYLSALGVNVSWLEEQ